MKNALSNQLHKSRNFRGLKAINDRLAIFAAAIISILPTIETQAQERANLEREKMPNILLVLLDDVGVRDMPRGSGTTLDLIASQGVVFNRALSASSICSPSRTSLMTSRHAWMGTTRGTGYSHNDTEDRALTHPTFAQVLKENGYSSFVLGKWGLPIKYLPDGFDRGYIWPKNPLAGLGVEKSKNGEAYGSRYWHPAFEEWSNNNYSQRTIAPSSPDMFSPDEMERRVFEAMQELEEPFFIYLSHVGPHGMKNNDYPQVPGSRANSEKSRFNTLIRYVDASIGRIIQGAPDDTVVMYTADNGTAAPIGGKQLPDNLGCHVHLGVMQTGSQKDLVAPRGYTDNPIDHADLGQTLLQMAGLEYPERVDGRDYSDFLAGRTSQMAPFATSQIHGGLTVITPNTSVISYVPGENDFQKGTLTRGPRHRAINGVGNLDDHKKGKKDKPNRRQKKNERYRKALLTLAKIEHGNTRMPDKGPVKQWMKRVRERYEELGISL